MSLPVQANLISAAMDLKLVRLLRGAMQPKFPHLSGAHGVPGPAPSLPGRPVHQPEPAVQPRPLFQPPPLLRPAPIVFFKPVFKEIPVEVPLPTDSCRPKHLQPLQPPWKTLPWECPPPPEPQIKVHQYRPDIITKGSLIDFYQ